MAIESMIAWSSARSAAVVRVGIRAKKVSRLPSTSTAYILSVSSEPCTYLRSPSGEAQSQKPDRGASPASTAQVAMSVATVSSTYLPLCPSTVTSVHRACCDPRLAGEGTEQLGGAGSGGWREQRVVSAGLLEPVADLPYPEGRPSSRSIRGARVVLVDQGGVAGRPAGWHRDRHSSGTDPATRPADPRRYPPGGS